MIEQNRTGAEVRALLAGSALDVAPWLLGAHLTHRSDDGPVTVRITEVEAYLGDVDPGSHAYRGRTPRNATMFGPAGHLYVYFTYGMHYCANIVCGTEGWATGLLVRAGEIVDGIDRARERRSRPASDLDLARGPARLAQALGLDRRYDGADALADPFQLVLPRLPAASVASGPRVGVSGIAGTGEYPWRFWSPGEPTVSRYRPGKPRTARKVDP
ncbi:DNA-3-methyladenine glycosylase [Arthrobacter agilis]|uniref:DNA-3-methyladenine glycosylase n=1 Tax=Arthrobacter agilis TaxID=37921 RepID=UPI000B34AA6F|nr:3-methyladenine DNA glycosylase [Arthrobacter agilis]PPB44924.1 DNA-3-methyladenine glycosylase [Arthrobacter agilis]TPV27628.1 DNA-3-methyladenine glycosylase [Arthrobacter agilis]VDR31748.1 3-methyladenine DNA glycosylase [Arthrobacter agilis]